MTVEATYPLVVPVVPTTGPGGSVPQRPHDDRRRLSIRRAPTKDDFLAALETVTAKSYHQPIIDDAGGYVAIYRQMACQAEKLASRALEAQSALFFLPYPTRAGDPASSLVSATFDLVLRTTKDRDQGRIMEIGTLDMVGHQGRRYTNRSRVEWLPFDSVPEKTVPMISENPGWTGNLDHLADPDTGLLVEPDTQRPSTRVLKLATQGGRKNTDASIEIGDGGLAKIRDSGKPDQFIASDVGLYVEIVASANAQNVGRRLKIVNYEEPGLQDPPNSGLFPHSITVDDGAVRHQIGHALADDGGTITDQSAQARDSTQNDMTLLPATAAVGDAYYFGGQGSPFSRIAVVISTAGVGDWVLVWEYWDGSAWTALASLADGTGGLTVTGESFIDYDEPSDWATTAVDSITDYWIRLRVTSVTTTTTAPLGQSATVFRADPLIAESGSCEWKVLDWASDLGFEIVQMSAPKGGRDDTLRLLGESRGVFQQSGESDDQFRQRAARLADSVTPKAITRAVNRELSSFGFRAEVLDAGNGFDGFFLDVDATDYYETGDPDAAPKSAYKLLTSNQEAYGWFFVYVPALAGNDWGMAWDSSPVKTVRGVKVASAWDVGYYDGHSLDANAAYPAIYDAVDGRRAGGIGFSMIRDRARNVDPCT